MSKGSFLRPLKALAYLGRPAVTLPMEPRPAAPNYRGFHVNDWEACIGCGTCAQICDNEAIDMVDIPELKADPLAGIKPRRPAQVRLRPLLLVRPVRGHLPHRLNLAFARIRARRAGP